MALARVCWIEDKASGPKSLFAGARYVTVARFEREAGKWPNEAWSLVVDPRKNSGELSCLMVDVHFLSPNGPSHLLTTGNKFELFEGRRCVAHGEILAEQQEVNRSLTA